MHSRRTFFGLLTGLAALVPLPVWARASKGEDLIPPGEFYQPNFDTDFLEIPRNPVSVYEWHELMELPGLGYVNVHRIKIMVSIAGDVPVMFDIPEGDLRSSRGSQIANQPVRRLILSQYEEDDHGIITPPLAEWYPETGSITSGTAKDFLATRVYAMRGYVQDRKPLYPIWVTLYRPHQPLVQMMSCTWYQLWAERDMRLLLPLQMTKVDIFRQPPSAWDVGEEIHQVSERIRKAGGPGIERTARSEEYLETLKAAQIAWQKRNPGGFPPV